MSTFPALTNSTTADSIDYLKQYKKRFNVTYGPGKYKPKTELAKAEKCAKKAKKVCVAPATKIKVPTEVKAKIVTRKSGKKQLIVS